MSETELYFDINITFTDFCCLTFLFPKMNMEGNFYKKKLRMII